jgi:hypothetical protein
METVSYVHLKPNAEIPALVDGGRFKAVVIIDADVHPDWQYEVSKWLVLSGCRYMMAWGRECGAWDDSVDWAALEVFNYYEGKEIGKDPDFVMTSWHEDEPLEEALAFCHHSASDPFLHQEFKSALLLHIAETPEANRVLQAFESAKSRWND